MTVKGRSEFSNSFLQCRRDVFNLGEFAPILLRNIVRLFVSFQAGKLPPTGVWLPVYYLREITVSFDR